MVNRIQREKERECREIAGEIIANAQEALRRFEKAEAERQKMIEAKRRDDELLNPPRMGIPRHLLVPLEYVPPYSVSNGQNEKPVEVGRRQKPHFAQAAESSERVG